ncbi:MAG: M1 family metallopeptidase [Gemmatimonadota bacterium]
MLHLFLSLLLAGGGGRGPAPAPPPAAPVAVTPAPASPLAAPADTLPVPHAFLEAMLNGTRTRHGKPGPRYWQQEVDYRIQTRLRPEEVTVEGSEVITYHNNSPDTLAAIWLNLPQNVFAPGNPRNRPVPVTGGFHLGRVVVQGVEMQVDAPRAGPSLGTVVGIQLNEPLPPGDSAVLEIEWVFEVPEGTFRMGREGRDVFFIAQWYPQVAVYDDLRGWARDPYMGDGEFYLEYGTFDVEITAPAGWLVSATGELQNPQSVLTPAAQERLAALSPDSVTHVVTAEERDAGALTLPGGEDGALTWHFRAEDVRDFAWGASPLYVWDATVAEYLNDDGTVRRAAIHSFYRPEKPNWERSAEYARHAIESHSYWYPYPYPQMTVNEGIVGGGMEYPMITIVGGGRSPLRLYGVISHELAHMWWPMVVGSDERNHAWMDEGLASFSEDLFTPEMFADAPAARGSMRSYLSIAGSDRETPSMRPADLYGPFGNRGVASYSKPATVFRTLRHILTPERFDAALRSYVRRWAFKHPHPLDLFWTFENVTGEDLDWYFYPWMYTTRVLDQAVINVRIDNGQPVVVLENRGEIRMPVELEVTTDSGEKAHVWAGHEAWEEDGRMLVPLTEVDGEVAEVVIDPDEYFPDINRENNVWRREP